jgi:flavin reductase (DIM6/NTAB) family NADH-FMN oxidoreductase RutF
MRKLLEQYRAVFPTPAALITSIGSSGRPNVATAGETYMMSLEPLVVAVGFRPKRYTNLLIRETMEFVVNLPKKNLLKAVDYCGMVSGRKIDKFKKTGLTAVPATYVRAPLIKECPVNIECRVRAILSFGSHDIFVGDSLAIHADNEVIGNDGIPDIGRFGTIAFANQKYYLVEKFLGKFGFSRNIRSIKI